MAGLRKGGGGVGQVREGVGAGVCYLDSKDACLHEFERETEIPAGYVAVENGVVGELGDDLFCRFVGAGPLDELLDCEAAS